MVVRAMTPKMTDIMTPDQERFVRRQRVGRLATADAAGQPHVIPVCFVCLDGQIYTPVDEKPKSGRPLRRLRNIAENPEVAVVFDHYEDDWQRLGWVLIRGTAQLVGDRAGKEAAIAALRRKYRQYVAMALEPRPLIHVAPRQVTSWGAV